MELEPKMLVFKIRFINYITKKPDFAYIDAEDDKDARKKFRESSRDFQRAVISSVTQHRAANVGV